MVITVLCILVTKMEPPLLLLLYVPYGPSSFLFFY